MFKKLHESENKCVPKVDNFTGKFICDNCDRLTHELFDNKTNDKLLCFFCFLKDRSFKPSELKNNFFEN